MDIEDASILSMANVDKSKLPPIHQKRILAFVNHFIITTCTFLNNFAAQCETRFLEIERKMQKVEAALIILESKLASINGLESITNNPKETEMQQQEKVEIDIKSSEANDEKKENVPQKEILNDGIKACEDSRYKKYFKMLQFGVPIGAVKTKMIAEGFNSDILDNPNQILEDGIKDAETA